MQRETHKCAFSTCQWDVARHICQQKHLHNPMLFFDRFKLNCSENTPQHIITMALRAYFDEDAPSISE